MKKFPILTDTELRSYGFNKVEIAIWHVLTVTDNKKELKEGEENKETIKDEKGRPNSIQK